MKKYINISPIRDLVGTIFDREYDIAYRSHTVGMEDMSIAPATLRAIYSEASQETEREISNKQWRLLMILDKVITN